MPMRHALLHAPTTGILLDVKAAALMLNCSEKAVRTRVSRQLLPFKRLGSRILFRRDELEQFIASLPGVSLQEAKHNIAMRSGTGDR